MKENSHKTLLSKTVFKLNISNCIASLTWTEEGIFLPDIWFTKKGTLFANYPSTESTIYLISLEKVAMLSIKYILPAHHTLDVQPEIVMQMQNALRQN